jgi:hypothetical protein
MTTVPQRTADELQEAPALATLPALSACIAAFVAALDLAHPRLVSADNDNGSDREGAARLLLMHLDACQHLLHLYDQLTFDGTYWCCFDPDDKPTRDEDDDRPF